MSARIIRSQPASTGGMIALLVGIALGGVGLARVDRPSLALAALVAVAILVGLGGIRTP